MRRRFHIAAAAALAVAAPLAGVTAVHGCSSEPDFESVCLWVSDPVNCYRKFRIDMEGADHTCKPLGNPTAVGADSATPKGVSNGYFLKRDKLDVCFINDGGVVAFDPPIDLSSFPPSMYATPTTYTMTFKDTTGNTCGNATYTSPHGFSFTINAPAPTAAPADAGVVTITDGGDGGPGTPYGSYTQVIAPGSDAFDVTCPTGETHHFNLYEVEGVGTTDDGGTRASCPSVAGLVPHAAFTVDPGGIDVKGAVSFTIYWSPIGAEAKNWPADNNIDPMGKTIDAWPITYFNCEVPQQPKDCVNGVQDGAETDVDCGGPEAAPNCPARCGDGQLCMTNCDCAAGFGCHVQQGLRICQADPSSPAGTAACPLKCNANADCGDAGTCTDAGTCG